MRASIVIASHNDGEALDRTIESSLDTSAGVDCEIVVADDVSSDGSVERIRNRFPGVRLVAHAQRRGVSQTKDLGARCARGDTLLFLDAHCKPEAGAIERLLADVEELDGDAIVTPRIAALDTDRWLCDLDQVGHGYVVDLDSFATAWIDLEDLPLVPGYGRRYFAQPTFIGCCAAMSQDLYRRLWGFDTGMRTYGTEDVDLGVRAWMLGNQVVHDPEPLIGHRFRHEFQNYSAPPEHMLSNNLRMARKTFSDPTWFEWLERVSERFAGELWEDAWREFLQGHESIERERADLQSRRVRDEFWYARQFNLAWPVASPATKRNKAGAPAPVPRASYSSAPQGGPVFTASPSPGPYLGRPVMGSPSPRPGLTRSPSPPPRKGYLYFGSPSPFPRPFGGSPSPHPMKRLFMGSPSPVTQRR
jgi:GT2 family glycosyltransferase